MVNAHLAKEAWGAKKASEFKIDKQTRTLKDMEANWKSESKQNTMLNDQTLQLKNEIVITQAK